MSRLFGVFVNEESGFEPGTPPASEILTFSHNPFCDFPQISSFFSLYPDINVCDAFIG